MVKYLGLSRRTFLKGMGAGSAAALLATAGLPLVGARRAAQTTPTALQSTPDVELLVGDVIGFGLEPEDWAGAFGWVTFRLHKAWYNGEDAFYIRTDASDQAFATENRLV
jgi:hypothetical protein